MNNEALVSIISVNYRQPQVSCDMLDSLALLEHPALEVWLVDNGAAQNQEALYKQHYSELKVITSAENLGFAGGNNLAIIRATGKYLLLLNNDTLVPKDFLLPLIEFMERHPEVGIVSPKIYYHNTPQIIQYAGVPRMNAYTGRNANPAKQRTDDGISFNGIHPTGYAHGACMLVRKTVFEQIGLLPEDYFLYYEELDFCEQARRAGWEIYYFGESHIFHRESVAVGKHNPLKTYYMYRNRWLFMRRNSNMPAYGIFVLYYLGMAVPLNLAKHALRREWAHCRAIIKAVAWNFNLKKAS
ncbi:MAG TPA: glycosyltransferase family 2 protein [Saprospiraceae bacterium]|nr:glycosyltransferase family 2 protein [Saprospiraceae bacterium]HMQ82258.1 glycosyltransferase family 2 protein [Saprospiraceae bacterium]